MAEIVPAVLAETPAAYQTDLARALALSKRVQIDVTDGVFAANRTINLAQLQWPQQAHIDLHLMINEPLLQLPTLIAQAPNLVIFHAEAVDVSASAFSEACRELRALDIKVGLALLPETEPSAVEPVIDMIDHVLIFTGDLGHYGGVMQQEQLAKATTLRRMRKDLELGVDGGVNPDTALAAVAAGIDVLNVGGYLQQAHDPQAAYATLQTVITTGTK